MGLSHTVSGDIASFRTPSRVPIESLKLHFLPNQEGSGDPSLSNVRPITGWTGCNLHKEGKNLIDKNSLVGTDKVWWKGKVTSGYPNHYSTPMISVKPGGTYYLDRSSGSQDYVCFFDKNGEYIEQQVWNSYAKTKTLGNDVYYVGITISSNDINTALLQFGSTNTSYADYVEGSTIPVTFPVSDSNLFSYDEDKFSLEDCITSSETTIRRQVYHTGLTNGVFTLTAQIKEGYTRPSYNLFNVGICENGVNTIINTFIGTTEYIRSNYVNSDQELIIVSTTDNLSTADSTIKRYDIEIKNDAFYGGYVDILLGEIVLTHAKTSVIWDDLGTDLGTVKRRAYALPFMYKTGQELHDNGQCEYKKMALCDKAKWKWDYTADVEHYYVHGKNAYIYLDKNTPNDTKIELCAMLAEPFHIAITPQQLKAFLDYNNFWSDANDITEVTYAVTESKDILATRKRAIAFDQGKHKIIQWNQLVKDGNFTGNTVDGSKWVAPGGNKGTISFENNVGTWTCIEVPDYYYRTGFTWSGGKESNYNYLYIPWNHKILVKAKAYCSLPCKVRMFTLVGSCAHVWAYNQTLTADTWTDVIGFIPDRNENPVGEDDGFVKRIKPCITGINSISEITVGTTFKLKDLMMFDLTQMFGLGKEPSTVAEFERICQINGIDLDIYQPYDAGSDRWLIVP